LYRCERADPDLGVYIFVAAHRTQRFKALIIGENKKDIRFTPVAAQRARTPGIDSAAAL